MNRRITITLVLAIMVSLFALTSITTPVLAVRPDGEPFGIIFKGRNPQPESKHDWEDKDRDLHIRIMTIEGATIEDCSISKIIGGTFKGIEDADICISFFEMHMWGRGRVTLTGEPKPSYQIQFLMTYSSTGEIAGSFKIKGRGEHIEGTDIESTASGGIKVTGTTKLFGE